MNIFEVNIVSIKKAIPVALFFFNSLYLAEDIFPSD